ncbi:MAG: hypothetical protein WBA67_00820 [Jannaschia sp.]
MTSANQLVLDPANGRQSVATIEASSDASFPYRMTYSRGPFRGKSFDFR